MSGVRQTDRRAYGVRTDRRVHGVRTDRRAYGGSAWWVRGSLGIFLLLFIIRYITCFAPFCIGMGGM